MTREEIILFPAMRRRRRTHPASDAVMRADEDDHAETIGLMRRLSKYLTFGHACCWRSPHVGAARLLDEAGYIALEIDVHFPRFERAA